MNDCKHKELKKQLVGDQSWYICISCSQKFKAQIWDGKVTIGASAEPRMSGELEQKVLDILDELTPEDADTSHPCHQAYLRIGKLFDAALAAEPPEPPESYLWELYT